MSMEVRSRIYVVAVAAAAAGVAGLAALTEPLLSGASTWWLIGTMTGLVALAGRFPFKVSPQGDATLLTVPLFMSVLMLPPLGAVLAGAVGTLIAERLLRAPVRVTFFNVSNVALTGGLAALVFHTLYGSPASLTLDTNLALSAAAAGLVLHSTNLMLLFGMITLHKGRAFWRIWKNAWFVDVVQEGALIALGLAGALVMAQAFWGLLLLLAPFTLGYYGFKRSVEEGAEKARLAEELQQRLTELKEAQAQLIQSAKLASVGTLAAGVAHEINNPIFAITGRAEMFLEMLRRTDDRYLHSQAAQDDMQTILNEGMRISSIVNHLLTYAHRSDDVAKVRIDEFMEDSLGLLAGKISEKGFNIVRDYQHAPRVMAVGNQIQQVIMNVLSNAFDATPDRGTITVGCLEDGGMALVYVKDTGVGISEDVRGCILEPFYTTKEVGKGVGLGLFLCHRIVMDLGGEILVQSEKGEGTTVTIRLPAVIEASQEDGPAPAEAVAS